MWAIDRLDPSQARRSWCRSLSCPYCAPVQAARLGKAIDMAEPNFFVTLAGLVADGQIIEAFMRALLRRLSRRGYAFEWLWSAEEHSVSALAHVHLLGRGALPPMDAITAASPPGMNADSGSRGKL